MKPLRVNTATSMAYRPITAQALEPMVSGLALIEIKLTPLLAFY